MSARALIDDLAARGVRFSTDGAHVDIDAPAGVLTETVLATIRRMKDDILATLSAPRVSLPAEPAPFAEWTADDWREWYDERLAVAMIDGEQPEPEARRLAWESCITQWLDLHPGASAPGRCAHCGRSECGGAVILPFGIGPHAWLHAECWRAWFAARRAAAVAALAPIIGDAAAELPKKSKGHS